MKAAYTVLKSLIGADAKHRRKGFKLSEATPQIAIRHAHEELIELANSPNDINELADALGCLLHYAAMYGWTIEQLEEAVIAKWLERFEVHA